MLEEIKKEINEQAQHLITRKNKIKYDNYVIGIYELEQILDKYNNQPDYKSAFEQVKREYEMYDIFKLRIEQIEKKHNIGGE